MKNYRKLLTQVLLLVWLGMACSYSCLDYDQIQDDDKAGCCTKSYCTKYAAAGVAAASSVIDLACCVVALSTSDDDTKRWWLVASDIFSMITFAARTGVLHSYTKILYKEMNRRGQITTDTAKQKVETDIFRKLSRGGFTTALTFVDLAASTFACETGLFSNQTQGIISAIATLGACALSIVTLVDLCCCTNINDPDSARRSLNNDSVELL